MSTVNIDCYMCTASYLGFRIDGLPLHVSFNYLLCGASRVTALVVGARVGAALDNLLSIPGDSSSKMGATGKVKPNAAMLEKACRASV